MNILKLIAKVNDSEIDMQQLCLKECLNIIKMKIYETHTIIYILNSFAAQSEKTKARTLEFVTNYLFYELFCQSVHKVELAPQYNSYILGGKSLVYKRPVRSQIFLKQTSASIDFDLVKQLITIVTVLSENDQGCFKAHSKYIFELAKFVVNCVEQRPA